MDIEGYGIPVIWFLQRHILIRIYKHKTDLIDYKKYQTNNAYKKRTRNKLYFYYFLKEYNLDTALVWLYKKDSRRLYVFIKFFDIVDYISQNEAMTYVKKIINKKCKMCNNNIDTKRTYCSSKCANNHKLQSPDYIKRISESVTKWHNDMNTKDKKAYNSSISKGVLSFYNNESEEDKTDRLSKQNHYNSLAWLSYNEYCHAQKIEILNDEEDFKKDVIMKHICKECNHVFYIKKSTSPLRPMCNLCHKPKKKKSQNEVYNFILETNKNIMFDTKSIIKPLELDIYDIDNKYAVEFDGLLPHSYGYSKVSYYSILEEDKTKHLRKTIMCETIGIQLFRIFENEWLCPIKQQIWKSVLNSKMNKTTRIYGRKTTIKEVDNKTKKKFLDNNHLQGSCNSSKDYGLYYNDDELVSLMTFGKTRFSKNYEWELIRFCNKINTTVVGGASKLLKHFERENQPKSLVSYANRRWSEGGLYKAIGFEHTHNSTPNYFYFKENTMLLESRNKYQKHKLSKVLEDFNPKETERENMFCNGYRRIWDSGNMVFTKAYID